MAQLIVNTFSSYALTDEEALQGAVLSGLQKQVLQNQRTMIAEEKLSLEFNTEKPLEFAQAEAYKRGQLEILSWLLETSAIAEEELNNPNQEYNLEE